MGSWEEKEGLSLGKPRDPPGMVEVFRPEFREHEATPIECWSVGHGRHCTALSKGRNGAGLHLKKGTVAVVYRVGWKGGRLKMENHYVND